MSTQAAWFVSKDGLSLNLLLGESVIATITRWSDKKTGEHAWWAVERYDGYSLGLCEHLTAACRRAAVAAKVDLPPPQDLLDEWGHQDPDARQPACDEPQHAQQPDVEVPRRALHGRCPCGHVWAVVYLPMKLVAAANAMRRATCPSCGNTKDIKVAIGKEVEAACKP